jgi:hypothetical protein
VFICVYLWLYLSADITLYYLNILAKYTFKVNLAIVTNNGRTTRLLKLYIGFYVLPELLRGGQLVDIRQV